MHDILSKLDSDEMLAVFGMLVGVVAILGGVAVAITAVVSAHRRRMQLDEMEATLKMEMIQRGMSAEEIERVLAAGMDGGFGFTRGRRRGWGDKCDHQRRAAESTSR